MTDILRRKLAVAKLIANAWTNEEFKARLTRDPKTVLKESGIEVHPDKEIRIVENTASVHYFVIPEKPAAIKSLSEQELYSAAGSELEFSGMVNKDSGSP